MVVTERKSKAGTPEEILNAALDEFAAPFTLSGIGMGLFFAPVATIVLSSVRPGAGGRGFGRQQRDPRIRRRLRCRRPRVRVRALGGYESGAAVVAVGSVAAFAIGRRARAAQVLETNPALELAA
jgi:hypothetical protein